MTWRRIAAAGLIALAAWSAWAFVFVPLWCHRTKGRLLNPSYQANERGGPADRALAARHLEQLEKCLAPGCRDIELLFLLAINHRTMGRPEVALDLYRQALALDRRPEIYANIADTQLALGNREEAFQNYVEAGIFFPGYLQLIDDGEIRTRVRAEIVARRPDLADAVARVQSGRRRSTR